MSTFVYIDSLTADSDVRAYARLARGGTASIFREGGEDLAVMIPAPAFRAIQEMIVLAMKVPLTCWDSPQEVFISSASDRTFGECLRSIGFSI